MQEDTDWRTMCDVAGTTPPSLNTLFPVTKLNHAEWTCWNPMHNCQMFHLAKYLLLTLLQVSGEVVGLREHLRQMKKPSVQWSKPNCGQVHHAPILAESHYSSWLHSGLLFYTVKRLHLYWIHTFVSIAIVTYPTRCFFCFRQSGQTF